MGAVNRAVWKPARVRWAGGHLHPSPLPTPHHPRPRAPGHLSFSSTALYLYSFSIRMRTALPRAPSCMLCSTACSCPKNNLNFLCFMLADPSVPDGLTPPAWVSFCQNVNHPQTTSVLRSSLKLLPAPGLSPLLKRRGVYPAYVSSPLDSHCSV